MYDISGQFILDLAEISDDPTRKLYDEGGNVLSTDTSEKFNALVTGVPQADAAAGPVNLCVYGEIEWADGGGPIPTTVEIPVTPVMGDTPSNPGTTLGVTLDGYAIHAPHDPAVEADAGLDDCNGHGTGELDYHANLVEENSVLTCFSGTTT